MSAKKRQPMPTIRDQRGTLVDTLTPRDQAESWALLAAMQLFVAAKAELNYALSASDLDHMNVLRAMLARSEGLG